MKPAIVVEDLGKMYRLGKKQPSVINLSERISNGLRSLKNKLSRNDEAYNEFWALKDINFSINHGEVVGIIGRNGAGKSTLLKILSRIVEPTTGKATVRGRLGSLLEVGTGFHPELTGRENIYLNGSILGMRRQEIQDQFSNIVDFSGISEFLDTPVKRYSSGMYVRLAFAVAAHLNPEILVIDEVLAVGDAAFQKQCLGKMREVSQAGRTVLFVSHNMSAVESLCGSCIYLQNGKVQQQGASKTIINSYLQSVSSSSAVRDLSSPSLRSKGHQPLILSAKLTDIKGIKTNTFQMGDDIVVTINFSTTSHPIVPIFGVVFKDKYDVPIFGLNNSTTNTVLTERPVSYGSIDCSINHIPLMPGSYGIDLFLGDGNADLDVIENAVFVHIEQADVFGSGRIPPASAGSVYVKGTFAFDREAFNA